MTQVAQYSGCSITFGRGEYLCYKIFQEIPTLLVFLLTIFVSEEKWLETGHNCITYRLYSLCIT